MGSKKMRWLVLILIGVLVLSIAGYLAVDAVMKQKEAAEAEEAASLVLFNFDSNTIDTVTLQTKEGDFTMEMNEEGMWVLTETTYEYLFELNSSYVTTVCSYMSTLTAEKKFNADLNNLAAYGLEDPVVLTCSAGEQQYTLYVGSPTATQENFYVMVPGNDTVFGISYEYGALFYGDTSYLKTPYMLNELDVDICGITLIRDGTTAFRLEQNDNIWNMEEPLPDANINHANVSSMISALVRLQLEAHLELRSESTDLSEYGLDEPAYTLIVDTNDGEQTKIMFSSFDFDSTYVYLLYEDTGEIVSMTKGNAGFLNTTIDEFLNSRVLELSLSDVAALDVTVDDIAFRMEMDNAGGQYAYNDIDIDELGEDAVSMFEMLFATISNIEFDSIDLEADVALEQEPAAAFCYTLTDGTQTQLSLIAIDDTTYWAVIDGEYTGMIVRRRALSSNSGVLTYYEKMTDLLAELQKSDS